jgi:hypothetical protein
MKTLAKGRRRERAKKRRSDLVFVIWRSRLLSAETVGAVARLRWLWCARAGGIVIWRSRLLSAGTVGAVARLRWLCGARAVEP